MPWFRNVTAHKLASVGAVVSSVGSFCFYYVPHRLFLKSYMEATYEYKDGRPNKLNSSVTGLCNEVRNDVKHHIKQTGNLYFYPCMGFEFFHFGCIREAYFLPLFKKAIIGIPSNFGWTELDNLKNRKILVGQEPVQWDEPSGERLKGSLLLSDNAKKFAIATTVYRTSFAEPIYKGLLASFFVTLTYVNCRMLGSFYRSNNKSRKARYFMYGIVGTAMAIMFIFSSDMVSCFAETQADKKASSLGIDYNKGGQEYITKILETNMAFREILGKYGEKYFTKTGNQEVLIRQPSISLSSRLDRLKKYGEEETLTES